MPKDVSGEMNLLNPVMSALMADRWKLRNQDLSGMPKEAVLSAQPPAASTGQRIMHSTPTPLKLARLYPAADMITPFSWVRCKRIRIRVISH